MFAAINCVVYIPNCENYCYLQYALNFLALVAA